MLEGTCSSLGMLKGYMVRERLGIPVLDKGLETKTSIFQNQDEAETFETVTNKGGSPDTSRRYSGLHHQVSRLHYCATRNSC